MNAPMPVNSDWPLERVQRLIVLVNAKHTSGQIAERMGITRNAVIGKCRRLDLTLQTPKSSGGKGKPRPSRSKAAKAARAGGALPAGLVTLPPLASAAIVLPVLVAARKPKPSPPRPMRQSKLQCPWLDGSAKPFKQCPDRAVFDYPYCEKHCRRAYINWPGAAAEEVAA